MKERQLYLERVEREQNVYRFYRLSIERDLFGRHILTRSWGRIGQAKAKGARSMSESYTSFAAAREQLTHWHNTKTRRGYIAA